MGAFSIWHLLIVLMVILVVFGAGRLPSVMGDMAKGVKAFKKGMADEQDPAVAAANKDKEIANHS